MLLCCGTGGGGRWRLGGIRSGFAVGQSRCKGDPFGGAVFCGRSGRWLGDSQRQQVISIQVFIPRVISESRCDHVVSAHPSPNLDRGTTRKAASSTYSRFADSVGHEVCGWNSSFVGGTTVLRDVMSSLVHSFPKPKPGIVETTLLVCASSISVALETGVAEWLCVSPYR